MNPNYAIAIKQNIDKLLIVVWISKKLNKATKKNPYPLPFFNEVLNTITWYEAYSFLDGYLRDHQIFIALEDRYKTTFVTYRGAFVWMVMPFGVKNGPPTFY